METGDGLLVRLRLTGGILGADTARAIAKCADSFGNGLVDLSARANLQLRGVTPATLPGLTEALSALGLLDETPEAESVRNVIASPLAGLDPAAVLDIRPHLRALESRLVAETALHALPGKFGFLIDDGGTLPLGTVEADIRFEALAGLEGPLFAVRVGEGDGLLLGVIPPGRLPDTAASLARLFLAWRGEGPDAPRRMGGLVRRLGASVMLAAANLPARPPGFAVPALSRRLPAVVGWHTAGSLGVFGIGSPFGRWSAADLGLVADLAERFGQGELRLTPWRAILLPGVARDDAAEIAARLDGRFILDPADARLAVAACPGAPACANATTPAPRDALEWAGLARRIAAEGIGLHVSGCAKGCAHPGRAPVTLVARDGRYDIVLDGTARDNAVRTGLAPAEVPAALARWPEIVT
jgi:precorrin-3B synthase